MMNRMATKDNKIHIAVSLASYSLHIYMRTTMDIHGYQANAKQYVVKKTSATIL